MPAFNCMSVVRPEVPLFGQQGVSALFKNVINNLKMGFSINVCTKWDAKSATQCSASECYTIGTNPMCQLSIAHK